ncbi:MAG TPA: type I methionyl aminopeptidase [Nitrospiria bacterium]|nr:type I methionyl aminopeptidase [Nitrospiria bacterium]
MIMLKSDREIEVMTAASRIVAKTLLELRVMARPGVTTLELDEAAESTIRRLGGVPAFKGYRNFPRTLCVSVNEEVVHGIPSRRRLQDGDIVGLDLGAIVEGYYGDAAVTVAVGTVPIPVQRLLQVTQQALYDGITQARVGNRLSDISHAVQRRAEAAGFSVVTDFVGHGIGRQLHEEPQIPNFGPPGQGPRLRQGMVLAIEPMVNMGGSAVKVLADRWTVVTQDGSLSAHFEHTIAISEGGPRVLTAWEGEPALSSHGTLVG